MRSLPLQGPVVAPAPASWGGGRNKAGDGCAAPLLSNPQIYPSNPPFPFPCPSVATTALPSAPGPPTDPQAAVKAAPGPYSPPSPLILHGDDNHAEHSVPAADSASSALFRPGAPPGLPKPFPGLADPGSGHGSTPQSHPQQLSTLLLLLIGCLLKSRLLVLGRKAYFGLSPPKKLGDPSRVGSTAPAQPHQPEPFPCSSGVTRDHDSTLHVDIFNNIKKHELYFIAYALKKPTLFHERTTRAL